MGDMRIAFTVSVGKPEGKGQLGRLTCRWEDNTGVDIREIMWKVVDWEHLTLDRDQWRALVNQ
jgi:hypothetical protein